MPDSEKIFLQAVVPEHCAGQRLDVVLAQLFPHYSRSLLQSFIRDQAVLVNGKLLRVRDKVLGGEKISVTAEIPYTEWTGEAIALDIIYEDDELLIINKPVGLIVHPGAGNPHGTLLNALIHRYPQSQALPRAGIIHRLDKETSGLMVIAKTLEAHHFLTQQLQRRKITRVYEAIVQGVMTSGGTIHEPLGRHPIQRTKMAVRAGGKEAVTHYRVLERYFAHSWLRIHLETGRTHQIRVHMAHLHYPIIGDPLYGGRLKVPAGISTELKTALQSFTHQALHATQLILCHPKQKELMQWSIPLPSDMQELLKCLRADLEARKNNTRG